MQPPDRPASDMIREMVKSGDPDRYLATLFAPPAIQADLFALYAFNIELARIGEQAREPQLGEIRLAWWREALAAPLGAKTGNPVADALAATRMARALRPETLDRLVDARGFDIQRAPMTDMDALDAYLRDTAGALFMLGAQIAGFRDARVQALCREAGLAYGLTGLMRALPVHAARGQLYIPPAFLKSFGVDAAALLRGEEPDGLKHALHVLRERAGGHLAAFRRLARDVPRPALPVFLPLALVPAYLRQLGKASHEPLTDIAALNPLERYMRLWLTAGRGGA